MKELIGGGLAEEITASSHVILNKSLGRRSLLILNRVRPKDVAEQSSPRWFLEPLHILKIIDGFEFRRYSSVKSEEFVIHQTTNWKCIEGFHE